MNKSRSARLRQALVSLPFGLLVLLGNVMYPSPSWAWGDLGHKIICQIAFEELNDKARNEVIRLIALTAIGPRGWRPAVPPLRVGALQTAGASA